MISTLGKFTTSRLGTSILTITMLLSLIAALAWPQQALIPLSVNSVVVLLLVFGWGAAYLHQLELNNWNDAQLHNYRLFMLHCEHHIATLTEDNRLLKELVEEQQARIRTLTDSAPKEST